MYVSFPAEIKSLQSNLTLEQILEREVNLRMEVAGMDVYVLNSIVELELVNVQFLIKIFCTFMFYFRFKKWRTN